MVNLDCDLGSDFISDNQVGIQRSKKKRRSTNQISVDSRDIRCLYKMHCTRFLTKFRSFLLVTLIHMMVTFLLVTFLHIHLTPPQPNSYKHMRAWVLNLVCVVQETDVVDKAVVRNRKSFFNINSHASPLT